MGIDDLFESLQNPEETGGCSSMEGFAKCPIELVLAQGRNREAHSLPTRFLIGNAAVQGLPEVLIRYH
jgi:hypothetical protein